MSRPVPPILAPLLLGSGLCIALVHDAFASSQQREPPPPPQARVDKPLGLRIDRQRDGVVIRWNRDSEALRTASRAVLEIEDGIQTRSLDLDSSELVEGSLFYKPSSDKVDFRLTAYAPDDSSISDAVQILGALSRLAANTPEAKTPAPPPVGESPPPHTKSAAPAPSPKAQPPPPSRPKEVQPPRDRKTLQTFVPPRPIKTVIVNAALFDPSLLNGIKQVEVEVDIDKTGNVTAARPSNTARNLNSVVLAAAISAAKGWVFEPAKIGQQNIRCKHTVVFRFAAPQNP